MANGKKKFLNRNTYIPIAFLLVIIPAITFFVRLDAKTNVNTEAIEEVEGEFLRKGDLDVLNEKIDRIEDDIKSLKDYFNIP